MSVLRLEQVRREIGDFVILDDLSGSVARGERIGLVGPNGAGKTTLLEIITGHEEPDGGRVITSAGTSIGMLPQEANLDPVFGAAPEVRAAVRAGAAEVERLEAELMPRSRSAAPRRSSRRSTRISASGSRAWTGITWTSAWTRHSPAWASRARIGTVRSRSSPEASRRGPHWRGFSSRTRTCCCWTSRPTTWTWARSSGSKSRCSDARGH